MGTAVGPSCLLIESFSIYLSVIFMKTMFLLWITAIDYYLLLNVDLVRVL